MIYKNIIYILLLKIITVKIIQVINFSRHGARTPHNNIYNNKIVNDLGSLNLTEEGMKQHYNLGKYLNNKYNNLLNKYDESKQKFYTSPKSRCQNSLVSQVTSIFEGKGQSFKGYNLDFDFYKPLFEGIKEEDYPELNEEDALPSKYLVFNYTQSDDLFTSKNCPTANILEEKLVFNPSNNKVKKIKEFTENYFKDQYPDLIKANFYDIFDNINCLKYMNEILLKEIEYQMVDDYLSILYFNFYKENFSFLQLKLHNIIRFIEYNLKNGVKNYISSNDFVNYIGMSGHEGIINIFIYILSKKNNLDCWIDNFNNNYILENNIKNNCIKLSKFASALLFELNYINDNEFILKILLKNENENTILFQGKIDNLFDIFSNYEIFNYEEKCNSNFKKILFN